MQTSVTELSDVEVKVEVELGVDRVNREFKKQLQEIGKRAHIKGFRKGKAPKKMIAKLYGGQLASDATRTLISDTLGDALDTIERDAVGEPQIDPVLAKQGEALRYSVRIEVKPDVKVDDWEGIAIEVVPASVSAEAVQAEIDRLRERFKERVPVEDRGADTGDVVVLQTTGKVGGEDDPRLTTSDLETKIGEQRLVPGFEDQLIGATVGETRTVSVSFPEEYHAPDLAGQPAEFVCEVTGLFVEELPEVDDDFAQDAGYDDVASLQTSLEQTQLSQAEERRSRDIEKLLVDELLTRNSFNAPSTMVQAQLQASARRLMMLMQMQGMPEEQAANMVNGQVEQLRSQAERAVKRYLLLDAFAKAQEITIGDEELNAEVVRRIELAGPRGEGLFSKEDEREELRFEMREKAALDLITERAEIGEAAPSKDTTDSTQEDS